MDPNGVKLNLFDAVNPLREPKKTEGAQAQAQWEQLWTLRADARAGRTKLNVYESARKQAIADHAAAQLDGGASASDGGL